MANGGMPGIGLGFGEWNAAFRMAWLDLVSQFRGCAFSLSLCFLGFVFLSETDKNKKTKQFFFLNHRKQ